MCLHNQVIALISAQRAAAVTTWANVHDLAKPVDWKLTAVLILSRALLRITLPGNEQWQNSLTSLRKEHGDCF